MHLPSFTRITSIALLSATFASCGYLFVHGPPADNAELDYFSCTESNVGPILDLIWAGLNVAGLVLYAVDEQTRDDTESAAVVFGVAWVGVSGSAAFVGFNKTKKCREAKAALNRRLRQSNSRVDGGVFAGHTVQPDVAAFGWGTVSSWNAWPEEMPSATPDSSRMASTAAPDSTR